MQTTTSQSSNIESRISSFFGDSTVPTGESETPLSSGTMASFSGFREPERALEIHETKALARAIIKKRLKEGEWEALLSERQQLLDKQFSGVITKSESNRLDYVRWSLDQIEDARYGASLDVLESSVARYESFLESVQQLKNDLVRNIPTKRGR
ncbi:hypothetical protein KDX25_20305 [Burkholderia cenocepacia]|uniref:hypothetical protein n=1 Tax=Burkholderia cenocepacia TaxID=95486 RepID=UPI000F56AB88|nr:hypothetical protein [Burkholderia cenocepacia]MBR8308748.1 hypothetical protein [Burkholderia cenocepacia]